MHCFILKILLSAIITERFSPDNQRPSSTVTIKDNEMSVLFDGRFPSTTPTIYFKRPDFTNKLNIQFTDWVDIKEIEVFGGMYRGISQSIECKSSL